MSVYLFVCLYNVRALIGRLIAEMKRLDVLGTTQKKGFSFRNSRNTEQNGIFVTALCDLYIFFNLKKSLTRASVFALQSAHPDASFKL